MSGAETPLPRGREAFHPGDPGPDVAHSKCIEFPLRAEVGDRPVQGELRECEPLIGDLAGLLLRDEMEPGEGAELCLGRAAAVERPPAASRLEDLQPLRGELGGHVGIVVANRSPAGTNGSSLPPTSR